MTRWRGRLLRQLVRLFRATAWVLLRVLPPQPHAVVHGWPDGEGNAVEVVHGLLRRYDGRVFWLLDRPERPPDGLGSASDRLVLLSKGSAAAVRASLRAEVTFFTHGLNTAVAPPPSRLVVNLWHGDGPKSTRQAELVKSTVAVSGAALWRGYKAALFGLSEKRVLLTGNPRVDQFDRPPEPGALERLGLTPGRRRVLWLPTYRQAQGPGDRGWSDGALLSRSAAVTELAAGMAARAAELGLELVLKPHPLDTDDYAALGCAVVTNDELEAAGVTLYQLLGDCDALVSDVSSAWVDYLVLDRPIGFYVPDLAELERHRGLNVPDFPGIMPGVRIDTVDEGRAFLDMVAHASDSLRPSTYLEAWAAVGPVRATGATDRLLTELAAFQTARGRPPLFRPA